MNKANLKLALIFIIGMLTAFLAMYFINHYFGETTEPAESSTEVNVRKRTTADTLEEYPSSAASIDQLTDAATVISYVKSNHELPDFYLTKAEARKKGWIASKGNLCDVLPGRAIGGDRFGNRERKLPLGKNYREADVNYRCGTRTADRIVFTAEGEVWLTTDHYKTFSKQ